MSNYAKSQENRLIKHLKKIKGVEIVEYYGSRKKEVGDVLCKYKDRQFRFDHKSTTNTEKIRLEYAWLSKLTTENLRSSYEDGFASTAVTFSLKSQRQMYCFATAWRKGIIFADTNGALMSYTAKLDVLERCVGPGFGICIDEKTYIYTLEDFIVKA